MKVFQCEEDSSSDIGFFKFMFIFIAIMGVPVGIGYAIQGGLDYATINNNKYLFVNNQTLICNKKVSKTLVSKSNAWRYNDEYFIKGDNVVPIVECEEFSK